jgi:hypothetical protein
MSVGRCPAVVGRRRGLLSASQQALALCRDLGNLEGQAETLNCLGAVQQETRDYPAATASRQQALATFRELGNRLGQAEALNGPLSSQTSATGQACKGVTFRCSHRCLGSRRASAAIKARLARSGFGRATWRRRITGFTTPGEIARPVVVLRQRQLSPG